MHARDLVELAAHLVLQQAVWESDRGRLSERALERYWTESKCRLDRWHRAIKQYQRQSELAEGNLKTLLWRELRPVLEEILCSEVLTRIWTAIVCIHDGRRHVRHGEPLARSVFLGQLEARNRTLTLMVRDASLPPDDALALNRLRRRCENWVDMLLAWLGPAPELGQFAFAPQRTEQFAAELRDERQSAAINTRAALLQSSLRAAFHQGLAPQSPSADLNRQIAAAILACFPSDGFDSVGRFKSLWQLRLEAAAGDTQGLIADFLDVRPPQGGSVARSRRF